MTSFINEVEVTPHNDDMSLDDDVSESKGYPII